MMNVNECNECKKSVYENSSNGERGSESSNRKKIHKQNLSQTFVFKD